MTVDFRVVKLVPIIKTYMSSILLTVNGLNPKNQERFKKVTWKKRTMRPTLANLD